MKQCEPALAHGKLLSAAAFVEGNGVPTGLPREDATHRLLRILRSLHLSDQPVRAIAVECQSELGAPTVSTGQDTYVGAGPIERIAAVVHVGTLCWDCACATLLRSGGHNGRHGKEYH